MSSGQRRGLSRRAAAGLVSAAGILIAVAGLAFVGRRLAADWDQTRELLEGARWTWLVAAVPLCLAGMALIGTPWRRIMDVLGHRCTMEETMRWFFPGQLGKYVPGGIWPVVGRGELAVRGGVPRTVAYTSVALSLALTYLAAALVALCFLGGALVSGQGAAGSLWALAVLPLGLAALHPRVLTTLVTTAERVLSKAVEIKVPGYRTTVLLVAEHVPAWLCVGVGTWLVARAFTDDVAVAQVLFAGVLSWIVGFVVIPVPGGIGVREAAFVAAATSLPSEVAATVAIASRLCFITADLLGAGLVMLIPRPAGRRPSASTTDP